MGFDTLLSAAVESIKSVMEGRTPCHYSAVTVSHSSFFSSKSNTISSAVSDLNVPGATTAELVERKLVGDLLDGGTASHVLRKICQKLVHAIPL